MPPTWIGLPLALAVNCVTCFVPTPNRVAAITDTLPVVAESGVGVGRPYWFPATGTLPRVDQCAVRGFVGLVVEEGLPVAAGVGGAGRAAGRAAVGRDPHGGVVGVGVVGEPEGVLGARGGPRPVAVVAVDGAAVPGPAA